MRTKKAAKRKEGVYVLRKFLEHPELISKVKPKSYKCPKCKTSFEGPYHEEIKYLFCPWCGRLLPQTVKYLKDHFLIIDLLEILYPAKQLMLEGRFDAAVRDAIITLEETVRNKSGLRNLYGSDLMAKALNFSYDDCGRKILKRPKIALNDLRSINKRNEQEGARLMLMGFMTWIRNIYMHTKGASRFFYCLQIITMTNLFLSHINRREKSVASLAEAR